MPPTVPLPRSVQSSLGKNTHPGLALDKYVSSWDEGAPPGKLSERVQKPTIDQVVRLSESPPPDFDFASLLARRAEALRAFGAEVFRCRTTGPFTLHLARASALENAGICLHPVYGFTYLPGSGLKGMARAYAETIWLPAQADQENAKNQVLEIFGNQPAEPVPEKQRAGAVVFHDAWPEQWPKLTMDILNNHHSEYYQGTDAPGDWENPVPVYFMAVEAGNAFSFAVSKRVPEVGGSTLSLAKQWLLGALCHLGAGAKTAAGYGSFKRVEEPPPALESPTRRLFHTTVELITPAFLAGAKQRAEDCELRPATLRGLLRWWWRTMHAGFVDVPTLRALEAAVWGDVESGGAVRLTVERTSDWQPEPYEKASKANMTPAEKQSSAGIPGCEPRKTTQGLWYQSFGMDEVSHGERRRRLFVPPGAKWFVSLVARRTYFPPDGVPPKSRPIPADLVLTQAKAALWLLCHFGGVGSKARKGFGSFADPGSMSLGECVRAAEDFRLASGLLKRPEQVAESSALGAMLPPLEIPTPWRDSWFALDQLGFSAQAFAQRYKHRAEKKALGLPRRIGAPIQGPFVSEKGDRHASPVHYHLSRNADGTLTIRIAAFPSKYLPDIKASREFLGKLLEYLKSDLERRVKDLATKGQEKKAPPLAAPSVSRPAPAPERRVPKQGELVEAVLVEDPKKKGRRFARHAASGVEGNIQNADQIPADRKVGDTVRLLVVISSPDQIQFRWPTDADIAKASASKPPAAADRGKGRPGRWKG